MQSYMAFVLQIKSAFFIIAQQLALSSKGQRMTREEFKKHIRNLFYSSKTVEKYLEQAYADIDKIFDEHEELIKPKSCDDCMFDYCGCSVQDSILRADNTATFETFCCNSFKKKDNA